jgi:hypothetical protein
VEERKEEGGKRERDSSGVILQKSHLNFPHKKKRNMDV